MLPFGMTIPATVLQRSEILQGLMNYPVLSQIVQKNHLHKFCCAEARNQLAGYKVLTAVWLKIKFFWMLHHTNW
jgi:hypothetical protein